MAKKKKTGKKASSSSNGSPRKKKASADKAGVLEKGQLVAVELPIRRHIPSEQKSIFSNHFVIRPELETFQLYFFDAQPPLVIESDSADSKKKAKEVQYAEANCVARVTIPASMLPKVIAAMQNNLEKYQTIQVGLESQQKDKSKGNSQ